VNLFLGLWKDARDGGSLHLVHKGTRANGPSIVSYGASVGLPGATYVGFPSVVFEQAVLSRLREIDPREVLPTGNNATARALSLAGKLAGLESRIEAIKGRLEEDEEVGPLVDVLRKLEKSRTEAADDLASAQRDAAAPLNSAWGETRSLLDALKSAPHQAEARVRLRAILRRIVDGIWCLFINRPVAPTTEGTLGRVRMAAVQFRFTGGAHRDYLIIHHAAHGNAAGRQEGSTWVRTFADAGDGPLDLRKQKDATKLLQDLARMDLSAIFDVPKRTKKRRPP
jgi:hypothetical protein